MDPSLTRWRSITRLLATRTFFVGGTNPFGLNNDAETVLCGPGGGSSVKITAIAASFTEGYIPSGSAVLTQVTHAWSAGSDTAETVSNVKMSSTVVEIGTAAAGADNNKQLWSLLRA